MRGSPGEVSCVFSFRGGESQVRFLVFFLSGGAGRGGHQVRFLVSSC